MPASCMRMFRSTISLTWPHGRACSSGTCGTCVSMATVRWRAPTAARISSAHATEEWGVRAPLREPVQGEARTLWPTLHWSAEVEPSERGLAEQDGRLVQRAPRVQERVAAAAKGLAAPAGLVDDHVDLAGAPRQPCSLWPVKSRTARGARRGSGGQLTSASIDLLAAAAATNDSPTDTGSLALPPLRPTAIGGLAPSTWPVLPMGRLFSTPVVAQATVAPVHSARQRAVAVNANFAGVLFANNSSFS
eukprot:scaffold22132_cov69-Phaeocystis_antarctica.AAC.6